jgi:hypothetical protein
MNQKEQHIELTREQIMNKLFCTFSQKEELQESIYTINREYKIMYGKIFVLASPESEEYMCTYNIELGDSPTRTRILPNTILLHRKKDSNTLYTINALNILIKSLNYGVLDTKFSINWQDYKNSMLLTQGESFRKLNTVIHNVIEVGGLDR